VKLLLLTAITLIVMCAHTSAHAHTIANRYYCKVEYYMLKFKIAIVILKFRVLY
jgi:hypothetical protein